MPYYALVAPDNTVLNVGAFETKEQANLWWGPGDHLDVVDIQAVFTEVERLKDQIQYDVSDVREMLDKPY